MASFKIQKASMDRVKREVQRKLYRTIRDEKVLNTVASALVKDIQTRGAVDEKGNVSNKEIGASWDKKRKELAKNNKTGKYYKPSTRKSFLSFTGQLLNSIKAKIQTSKGLITIAPTGVHKKYKKTKGKNMPNLELLRHLEKQGYYILVANDKLRKKVVDIIRRELRKILK